jgi:hypothetical protein
MVLLIIMIVILAAFAGCLGGEAEEKKAKTPTLVQKHAKNPTLSGWIDHDGNQHASGSIGVNLNETNIVQVKFTVKVEDSDADHSETDQGSDPDDVTVTISGGNFSEKKTGITPFSTQLDFGAPGGTETPQYLDSGWTVQIDSNLGGGKPVYFFGFIVYVDQGVAYTIDADYTYMAPEETG